MSKFEITEPVAKAIRIDYNKSENKIFLVFEITNEKFRQEILKDWTQDIELVIKDKKLYLGE